MSSPNNLEINGNLLGHPLAELLVEILQARLDGSLRLSHQSNKIIIYITEGEVVFAVSNQRRHRIFEMLLQTQLITKQKLVEIPEFTNDFALAKHLEETEMFSGSSLKAIFSRQIEGILRDGIAWKEGIWIFSPLSRIKEDIHYPVDTYSILIEYARNVPKDAVVRRFKSLRESFGRNPMPPSQINLHPSEAFLLSRFFDKTTLKIDEIKSLGGLSDTETLQNLYILWLAGFLYRENWDSAFKEQQISAIFSAKFELKKQAAPPVVIKPVLQPVSAPAEETKAQESEQPAVEEELSLEKYLKMVETSETHYQSLNISHKSTGAEIKQAYFSLAKRFHPDLFQKQTDPETHLRVQRAFSEIAHAYEVLRDPENRQTYDFKLRKLLQELEKLSPEERNQPKEEQKTLTEVAEIFEHGFNLLMEEDYEQAQPYISRAVHLSPDNARFQAYYGKVLSMDKTQRFKAEAALQTAIKLDADNPSYRIMLAEFFIKYNLVKRAEGELNRLLAIFPNNKEARALLDTLR